MKEGNSITAAAAEQQICCAHARAAGTVAKTAAAGSTRWEWIRGLKNTSRLKTIRYDVAGKPSWEVLP